MLCSYVMEQVAVSVEKCNNNHSESVLKRPGCSYMVADWLASSYLRRPLRGGATVCSAVESLDYVTVLVAVGIPLRCESTLHDSVTSLHRDMYIYDPFSSCNNNVTFFEATVTVHLL